MGPRTLCAAILMLGWGLMLLGHTVALRVHQPTGTLHWDGVSYLLLVLFALSAVGGFVGAHLDYRRGDR